MYKAVYNGAGRFFISFRGAAGHYFTSWISHFLLLVSLLCVEVLYTSFFCKLLPACSFNYFLCPGMRMEFICGDT